MKPRNSGVKWMTEYEKRLKQTVHPRIDNRDGTYSTHSIAVDSDREGNWKAYPTVQPDENGVLQRMGAQKAMAKAIRTGNYKDFGKDGAAALAYGEGDYKRGTVADSQHNRAAMLDKIMRGERRIGYVDPRAPKKIPMR